MFLPRLPAAGVPFLPSHVAASPARVWPTLWAAGVWKDEEMEHFTMKTPKLKKIIKNERSGNVEKVAGRQRFVLRCGKTM